MKTVCIVSPRTISGLLRTAAKADVRHYLNGVLCEPDTGYLVSANGHALVLHRTDARITGLGRFIIPRELLEEAVKGARIKASRGARLASQPPTVRISIAEDGTEGERAITLERGTGYGGDFLAGPTFPGIEVKGTFPQWRRNVPTKPSGEVTQFNPAFLAEMQASLADICDAPPARHGLHVTVHHNGQGPSAITCDGRTDTLGILMPWKTDGCNQLPATLEALGLLHTAAPESKVA